MLIKHKNRDTSFPTFFFMISHFLLKREDENAYTFPLNTGVIISSLKSN